MSKQALCDQIAGDQGVMSPADRRIATLLLDIAERILRAGGEAGRVEDTMQRMCKAYGFRQTDIFTITSCIIVTVEDRAGNRATQMRRIRTIETDMERVRALNDLSRRFCAKALSAEELSAEIRRIDGLEHYGSLMICGAYVLIAACMTVFFGGTMLDFLAAAMSAPLSFFILRLGKRAEILNFMVYFADAFLVGLLIYVLLSFGIGAGYDKIAMGNIMILIPGAALTTAVRDMINGDIMTGLIGLVNALIQAAAIALGFVTAYTIFL